MNRDEATKKTLAAIETVSKRILEEGPEFCKQFLIDAGIIAAPTPNISLTDKANEQLDDLLSDYKFAEWGEGENSDILVAEHLYIDEKEIPDFKNKLLSFIQSLNLSAEQVASDAWDAALLWYRYTGTDNNPYSCKKNYLSSLKGEGGSKVNL